jgi:hypothetical protein
MKIFYLLLLVLIFTLLIACSKKEDTTMNKEEIINRADAYADITISVDLTTLSEKQKLVVSELLAAAKIADQIFWKQSSFDALSVAEEYKDAEEAIKKYITINYGPYDRIFDHERFIGKGQSLKPAGAGFYPEDLTRADFEDYITRHPDKKEFLESLYTIVKRENGELKAIPYHKAYSEEISSMADYIKRAAGYAENSSLKEYLNLRAQALQSDEYYPSDLAWLDLEGNAIDIVIGPIENYEDRMFNYKAAYEAAVMIKDIAASEELDIYKTHLDALEKNLPIANQYKRESAGSGNVLEVVNIVYFGGDFQAGIKTIAASLPNDERVISEKGAKKQLYKNIIEAKYTTILTKIADVLIAQDQKHHISKDSFVSQVLRHELSHTIGPNYVFNTNQSVRRALKETYSTIEECKADVLGIYHIDYLNNIMKSETDHTAEEYVTFLAGLFRSIRFGYEEAHGAANLIQLNFLDEEGVLTRNPDKKTYAVDLKAFHPAITKLATRLLMIEATGDYAGAVQLIKELGHIRPHTLEDVARLSNIPRDLNLIFNL